MKKVLLFLSAFSLLFTGCDFSRPDDGYDTLPIVTVTENSRYIQIEPADVQVQSGLIFYPGAMIEPSDYIDPLQLIAAEGYRVLILKSMMNMAIFNIQGAGRAMRDFSDIDNWIIGGHSLGGVAAVKAVLEAPESYQGLILMAAYPEEGDDLSQWSGAALSISAENDGLTTADDIEASKAWLPEALVIDDLKDFPKTSTEGKTVFYEIAGGNHAQFGNYGEQDNDGQADISQDAQHQIIKDAVMLFFSVNKL